MADKTTELQLQFGLEPTATTFSLETDSRDAARNKPVVVKDNAILAWERPTDVLKPHKYDEYEILTPVLAGAAHVRLYTPVDFPVDLVSTEKPIALENYTPGPTNPVPLGQFLALKWLAASEAQKPTGVIGKDKEPALIKEFAPEVLFVGVEETTVIESLTFTQSRSAFIKFNYAEGVETIYCTEFLDAEGNVVSPPQYRPDLGGALFSKVPCTGAVVIKYNIKYRVYKVSYMIPRGLDYVELQRAWLCGDIGLVPMPPATVFAISEKKKRVAQVDIQKDVFPRAAALFSWSSTPDDTGALVLTESERKTKTVRVTSENDPNIFVDVQVTESMVLVDANGVRHSYRFKV